MAAIDCCTREIGGWHLELRCRARGDPPRRGRGRSARRAARNAHPRHGQRVGVHAAHRRGGYRDPESQASIESWFANLKERCVWLHEFETLDEAREVIAAHIDRYHHRPHSGAEPSHAAEVAQTWDDALGDLHSHAA